MAKMKKKPEEKISKSPKSQGTLYIIATPIGNLEDITLRALRILKEVDLIAAEDTRHTRKLLTHYNISTPTFSYYKEKEQSRSDKIIEKLLAGHDVGLVSDAGTPGVSDPGAVLVQKAINHQIQITPIPGPSSLTAALSVAGIAHGAFVFVGFAPSRKKQRQDFLQSFAREKNHLVFFEAPHRLEKFLNACLETLGDRHITWGREITKIHEEFIHGSLVDILNICKNKNIKGESVLIIAGSPEEPPLSALNIERLLTSYKNSGKFSLKDAVQTTTNENKVSRSTVYSIALRVWGEP